MHTPHLNSCEFSSTEAVVVVCDLAPNTEMPGQDLVPRLPSGNFITESSLGDVGSESSIVDEFFDPATLDTLLERRALLDICTPAESHALNLVQSLLEVVEIVFQS